ncbi:MAG: hypothetical protein HY885_09390 [Deltaproteobacteria bacterium]|nr:hypothetical protein [Deltaproteobacteria bacterium]
MKLMRKTIALALMTLLAAFTAGCEQKKEEAQVAPAVKSAPAATDKAPAIAVQPSAAEEKVPAAVEQAPAGEDKLPGAEILTPEEEEKLPGEEILAPEEEEVEIPSPDAEPEGAAGERGQAPASSGPAGQR